MGFDHCEERLQAKFRKLFEQNSKKRHRIKYSTNVKFSIKFSYGHVEYGFDNAVDFLLKL